MRSSLIEKHNSKDHWDGQKYSKNSNLQYIAAMNILGEYSFNGDENILDIGCGDGKITKQLASMVPKGSVLGIDSSVSMIEVAKNHLTDNLKFIQMDAQNLIFDQQFDVVASLFCLQWVPNKKLAFQGIVKSLKDHGRVILVMPLRNQITAQIRREMLTESRWENYFSDFFDTSDYLEDCDYKKYAEESGLDVSMYTVEPVTTRYRNSEEFSHFFSTITPHLTRLPTDQEKDQFMQQLVERYLQKVVPENDGSCHITFQYVIMHAQRLALNLEDVIQLAKMV